MYLIERIGSTVPILTALREACICNYMSIKEQAPITCWYPAYPTFIHKLCRTHSRYKGQVKRMVLCS